MKRNSALANSGVHACIEMLLRILEVTTDAIPELPETRAIFDPENLDAIWLSTPSRDLRPFNHFFNTLSDELIGIVKKDRKTELDRVIAFLNHYKLLEFLLEWMVFKKKISELRLSYMEQAIRELSQEPQRDKVQS